MPELRPGVGPRMVRLSYVMVRSDRGLLRLGWLGPALNAGIEVRLGNTMVRSGGVCLG